MANRYAGLDPTWAHLPTPAPTHAAAIHYCSSRPGAFENEALTSALRASMAPVHGSAAAAASSFSTPATPSSSTSSASEILSSGHDAPAPAASFRSARPPAARALKGPKGGGVVSKRKPRPSRRAPTTYITADPANFRRMVQEITGLPVPVGRPSSSSSSFPAASEAAAAPLAWTPPPAYVLPTLDTSAFLLDRATTPAPALEENKSSIVPALATTAPAATVAAADESSLLLEMEAMINFPTLESWGII